MNKYKLIIKYSIISIIVVITISEVLLRIFFHEQLKTQISPDIFQADTLLPYSHIPNKEAEISIPSIHKKFKLNNMGMIGNNVKIEKEENTFRIAIIGNCITEGIWYNEKDPYPMILQNIFNDKGDKIEIINYSYGTGNSFEYSRYLFIKTKLINYKPDLVLFNTDIPISHRIFKRENYHSYDIQFINEASKKEAIKRIDYIESKKVLTSLYDLSYIIRALCKKYIENSNSELSLYIKTYREHSCNIGDKLQYYSFTYNSSIKLLSLLKDELNTKGIKFWLFFVSEADVLEKTLKEVNVDSFSLGIELEPSLFYKHDGHLNVTAHTIIANKMYDELIKRELIPKEFISVNTK